MIEDQWNSLLPHRVEVYQFAGTDYYGEESYEVVPKVFRCLVDTKVRVARDQLGTEVTVGLTAFCKGIPEEEAAPVAIGEQDRLVVIDPAVYGERPIVSIGRHYEEDGTLHNQEVMLS